MAEAQPPRLVKVEGDPFAASEPKLVKVEGDPFAPQPQQPAAVPFGAAPSPSASASGLVAGPSASPFSPRMTGQTFVDDFGDQLQVQPGASTDGLRMDFGVPAAAPTDRWGVALPTNHSREGMKQALPGFEERELQAQRMKDQSYALLAGVPKTPVYSVIQPAGQVLNTPQGPVPIPSEREGHLNRSYRDFLAHTNPAALKKYERAGEGLDPWHTDLSEDEQLTWRAGALTHQAKAFGEAIKQAGGIDQMPEAMQQEIRSGLEYIETQYKDLSKRYPKAFEERETRAIAQASKDATYAWAKANPSNPVAVGILTNENVVRPAAGGLASFGGQLVKLKNVLENDPEDYHAAAQQMEHMVSPTGLYGGPKVTSGPVFGKEGINYEAALPRLSEQLATMFVFGGAANAGKLPLLAAGFTMAHEEYFDEALAAGLSFEQASKLAAGAASLQAGLELVSPLEMGSTATSGMVRANLKNIIAGGTVREGAFKEIAGNIAKELAQEHLQDAGDVGSRAIANEVYGDGTMSNEYDLNRFLETTFLTALATGGFSMAQKRNSPLYHQSVLWATSNPEEFTKAIDGAKGLTDEQKESTKERMDLYKKVLDGMPEGPMTSQRMRVADLAVEHELLKQRQKEVKVDDMVAETVGDPIGEQIAANRDAMAEELGVPKPSEAEGAVAESPVEPKGVPDTPAPTVEWSGEDVQAKPAVAEQPVEEVTETPPTPQGFVTKNQKFEVSHDAETGEITAKRLVPLQDTASGIKDPKERAAAKRRDAEANHKADIRARQEYAKAMGIPVDKKANRITDNAAEINTTAKRADDVPDVELGVRGTVLRYMLSGKGVKLGPTNQPAGTNKSRAHLGFGDTGRSDWKKSGEEKGAKWAINEKEGQTVEGIAHSIWENWSGEEKPDIMDITSEVIDVIRNGGSRANLASQLNDYIPESDQERMDRWEREAMQAAQDRETEEDTARGETGLDHMLDSEYAALAQEVEEADLSSRDHAIPEEERGPDSATEGSARSRPGTEGSGQSGSEGEGASNSVAGVRGDSQSVPEAGEQSDDIGDALNDLDDDDPPPFQRTSASDTPSTEGVNTGKPFVDRVLKALSDIAPGLTVTVHQNEADYGAAGGEARSAAFYDPAGNAIHVNLPRSRSNTMFHEAAHVVLEAAIASNPELATALYDQLAEHQDFAKYKAFGERYADQGEQRMKLEAVVEFMADVADGTVPVRVKADSLYQRFKQWLKDLLAKVGLEPSRLKLDDPADLKKLAGQFAQAMKSGKVMEGVGQVPRGASALEQIVGEEGARGLLDAERILEDLDVAKRMETDGRSAEQVKLATGWEKGVDQKWFYEVPDARIKDLESFAKKLLNEQLPQSTAAEEVFDAPELFRAYPRLRTIAVRFVSEPGRPEAEYRATDGSIAFNVSRLREKVARGAAIEAGELIARTDGLRGLRRVVAHELSHAVQHIEGFAQGGSPGTFKYIPSEKDAAETLRGQLSDYLAMNSAERSSLERDGKLEGNLKAMVADGAILDKANVFGGSDTFLRQKLEAMDQLLAMPDWISDNYERYQVLAGEVQARGVQKRLDWTDEERRARLLADMEDIDNDQQVVLKRSVGLAFSQRPNASRTEKLNVLADRLIARGIVTDEAIAQELNGRGRPDVVVDAQEAVRRRLTEKEVRPKRRLTERVNADPSIPEEIKEAFTENAIYYERIPHSTSKAQAQALLDQMTDKEAEDAVLDTKNRMHLAVRFLLGIEQMRRYQANKDYDAAASFYDRFVPMTTEAGQGVAALRELGAVMGKTGLVEQATRDIGRDLTEGERKKLDDLAKKVEDAAEGRPQFEAMEDLLKYQAQLKGLQWWEVPLAVWYANMLSGPVTHLKNFVANAANATLLYANAVAQRPTAARFYARAVIDGTRRGILEAGATWNTGYSPIRGKVEIPPVLERVTFTGGKFNPGNYLKYVRRAMVAADVLFFEGLKEMRAYQLALKEASSKDTPSMPGESDINRALDLLNKNDEVTLKAEAQAQQEYEAEMKEAKTFNDRRTAKRNRARRVFELVERGRNSGLQEDAQSFAARGTYNYKPEGFLGLVAEQLNQLGSKAAAFRLVVPFTNIIANVTNDAINYTPAGALRAKLGRQTFGKHNTTELTDQEKADLYTKAALGTALMTAAFILSQPGDDEEPVMEITANGTGDWRKNEELRKTGWQPYSVRVGNTWISYQYTPMLLGLGYIGNIRDFEKYRDGKLSDKTLTRFTVPASWATTTMLDQTFLSSLDSFLGAVTDERNEDKTDAAVKGLSNTMRSFVVPNLYTQMAAEAMESMRIPEKNTQGDYALLGRMLRDMPAARNVYQDKLNGLGEPVYTDRTVFTSERKDDPVWSLIAEKRAFVGVPGRNSTTIVDPKTRKERLMTDKEYFTFVRERGAIIRAGLEANMYALRQAEPEKVRAYMTKLKTKASKHAKAVLWHRLEEQ